jgi:hypothetical protein
MGKLDELHPILRRKVKAVLADLEGHGLHPVIAVAWRSPADQVKAFKAGHSQVRWGFHCATYPDGRPCALACDVVDAKKGWGAPAKFWKLLASSRDAHGLHETADWDPAHIQLLPNSMRLKVKGGWLPPDL